MKNHVLKILVSGLLLFQSFQSTATSITVSGTISSNTTWLTDTVKIMGDLTILNTVKLNINPGTLVEVYGAYLITVEGWISANGTSTDSVIFTTGGSATAWKGMTIDYLASFTDTMRLTYTDFRNCVGEGALRLYKCRQMVIDHCTFKGAVRTNDDGGAIYMYASDPVITHCYFANNFSIFGGAVLIESGTSSNKSQPYLAYNEFISNAALNFGGAIGCQGGGTNKYDIVHNYFRNNKCSSGGAIGCLNARPNIVENNFIGNLGTSSLSAAKGGAIFLLNSSHAYIANNTLDSNKAFGGSGGPWGGGIFVENSDPKIEGNLFRGNAATQGAAIQCMQFSDAQILNNTFMGTPQSGAVSTIHTWTSTTSILIDGNSFIDCKGNYEIVATTFNTTITNNTFENCLYNGNSVIRLGYNNANSTNLVQGNTIINCNGMGIRAEERTMVIDNHIEGCTEEGIYCDEDSYITLLRNTVVNNAKTGIHMRGGIQVYAEGNKVYGNSYTGKGGGFRIYEGSAVLINNEFRNNTATHGGGIYFSRASSRMIGNLIANNSASVDGGGVYTENDDSLHYMVNNTIVNNHATGKGGGIYHYAQCDYQIHNTILYGNTASSGPQMSAYYDNYDPDFYNCNIQGGTAGIDWNFGSFTGTNIAPQDTNPQFNQPASGTGAGSDTAQQAFWSLASGSTLIDSGAVDTSGLMLPTFDLIGRTRIINNIIDIGAYEVLTVFNYASVTFDDTLCSGDTLIISGNSNWNGAVYQWYLNDSALAGATADTLFLPAVDTLLSGVYRLAAISSPDTGWSDSMVVAVRPPAQPSSIALDTVLCSYDSLLLSTNAGYANYSWNQGGSLNDTWVSVSGNYFCTVTDANGCKTNTDTATIVRIPAFNLASLGNDDTLCGNDSLLLTASVSSVQYLWNTSATSQSIYAGNSGSYYVTVTDTNNCSETSDTIQLAKFPKPTSNWSGSPVFCANEPAVVLSNGSPSGGLYLGTGIVNDSLFDPNGLGGSAYSISYVYADPISGCKDTSGGTVLVHQPLAFNGLGNDTALCAGDSMMLDGGSGFSTYSWSTTASSQQIWASSANLYKLTVTDVNGCIQADSMNLAIHALPMVGWAGTPAFCSNEGIEIIHAGSPVGGVYKGAGISNDSLFNPMGLSGMQAITYTYTDNNTCTDSVSGSILVNVPKAFTPLNIDSTLCYMTPMIVTADPGFKTYAWSTGDSTNPVSIEVSGQTNLTLIDSNNCIQHDSLLLQFFDPLIAGTVTDSFGVFYDSTLVYLLEFSPSDSSLTVLDSMQTDALGQFVFHNTNTEVYLKAYPDSGKYPGFVPSYYHSSSVFQYASALPLDSCDTNNVNISLLHGTNPGGSGVIGGTILLGSKVKSNGDPVIGQTVVLVNSQHDPVAVVKTDQDGYFRFDGLSLDTFFIWVDKPFIENEYAPKIVLSNGAQVQDSLDLILNLNYLELLSTGISQHTVDDLVVGPIPADERLMISGGRLTGIRIIDMQGRTFNHSSFQPKDQIVLDMSSFKNGIYILEVQRDTQVVRRRIVVAH